MYLGQAWSDVLTDIMIIAMPLPGVRKLAPLQMLTNKAPDLEASIASDAEILCDSHVPIRSTVSISRR